MKAISVINLIGTFILAHDTSKIYFLHAISVNTTLRRRHSPMRLISACVQRTVSFHNFLSARQIHMATLHQMIISAGGQVSREKVYYGSSNSLVWQSDTYLYAPRRHYYKTVHQQSRQRFWQGLRRSRRKKTWNMSSSKAFMQIPALVNFSIRKESC